MIVKAIHDKVWILPDPPIEKIGLIYVPDAYQSTLWSGTVVAVGEGAYDERGRFTPTSLKVGDHVVIDTARAVQNTFEGVDYMITREKEIMGIVTEEGEVLSWKNQGRPTRQEWEKVMYETERGRAVRKTA